jgi:hypothetical protein
MDSILGKVIAATLVLLAVVGVIVYAATGYFSDQEAQAVTAVSTIAVKIRGDYANNPRGYASLNNLVAIAAGDVPAGLVKGSSIVNPWGSPITISPLAVNGAASDFSIDYGAVPIKACVRMLTTDGSLMGASVNGTQVVLPVDPAVAAQACAAGAVNGLAELTSQYGQALVPTIPPPGSKTFSYTGSDQTFKIPAGATQLVFTVAGAGGGGGEYAAGGAGGSATGEYAVSPGQSLTIVVGAAGPGTSSAYSGGGGGGYSAVESSGSMLILAAGGGGGAFTLPGGAGGGLNGAAGAGGGYAGITGGQGGTQTAGGPSGGSGYQAVATSPPNAGSYLQGGGAGSTYGGGNSPLVGCWAGNPCPGGGGGGYYGGGVGAGGQGDDSGGGGGGGSSYLAPNLTNASSTAGGGGAGGTAGKSGAPGSVTVSWN